MAIKILQPGALLKSNSYRITRLLGQGGFGAVYLADDLILEKPCAIKESFDNSPGAQAQFEVEARILANLAHPHLPRVTDNFIDQATSLQYLVMEYVEGQNLGELLQTSGPPTEEQARAWADQVLDALAYLHAHRPRPIIHRDIKPDNIRLLPDGKTVKLVDFGIAKLGGAAVQTRKDARGITSGYSPPEQYGMGGTGPYSDVYALGATLYHLLTNSIPPDAIDRAHSGAQLIPPRQLNPAISEALEQIILTAMQITPALRFPDAAEMRAALQNKRPTVILVSCPHCGTAVRPEAKFCAMCGKPIPTAKPAPTGISQPAGAPHAPQAGPPPVQVVVPPPPFVAAPSSVAQPPKRSFELETGAAAADLPGLLRLCDQNWPAALGWLTSGRLAAFFNFLGNGRLEGLAVQAVQQADLNAALEILLRAAGARPPSRYRANLRAVQHALGFGLSFQFLRKPAAVRLAIQNTDRRGYLHGRVRSLAPWLSLPTGDFGCLPGQTAYLDLRVDRQARQRAGLKLRTALFEIEFL